MNKGSVLTTIILVIAGIILLKFIWKAALVVFLVALVFFGYVYYKRKFKK